MLILGYGIIFLGILALASNLWTSYKSHCGSIGQIPVLAAACIQDPLLFILGLVTVDRNSATIDLAIWHYVAIWVALVLGIGWLTIKAGELGERPM